LAYPTSPDERKRPMPVDGVTDTTIDRPVE
jgi:hypothetical protein